MLAVGERPSTAEIADPTARTKYKVDLLAIAPESALKTREPPSR
ncbi:hypothetical protein ACWD5Q_08710 [Streptomyces sp. NPDC002513]